MVKGRATEIDEVDSIAPDDLDRVPSQPDTSSATVAEAEVPIGSGVEVVARSRPKQATL